MAGLIMPVSTNFQVNGMGRAERERIEAAVARSVGTRPGRWRVQLIGDMRDEEWELRVSGPALETAAYVADRDPDHIGSEVVRLIEQS